MTERGFNAEGEYVEREVEWWGLSVAQTRHYRALRGAGWPREAVRVLVVPSLRFALRDERGLSYRDLAALKR